MITIRAVRPTEGPSLRAIRLRALAESPRAFGSTLAETEARPPSYWDARARGDTGDQKSTLFVAEDASGWVGLAGCFLDTDDEGSAELISMWVDPAYRGQGLGRRLVEQVVDWARGNGARSISLWVTDGNSAATALYARCGFKRTEETQPLPSSETLRERRMVREL